jgi:dUTPase
MKVFISGDTQNISLPKHGGDLGYDLSCSSEPKIVGTPAAGGSWKKLDYIEYDTGIRIDPSGVKGIFPLIYPRSSISNTNLIMANGVAVIDIGYRGNILVRFKYCAQPNDYRVSKDGILLNIDFNRIYQKGDRVAQIVFAQEIRPELKEQELSSSDRKEGGFGSTGS